MAEPISPIVGAQIGKVFFDTFGGGSQLFPQQVKDVLAAGAQRRRAPTPTPGPVPSAQPPVSEPVSSGAVSIGARIDPQFLPLSRALVEGGQVGGITVFSSGFIGPLIKIGKEIIKRFPRKTKPLPKPKPKPPPKPSTKDPRRGKAKIPKRERPFGREPQKGPPAPKGRGRPESRIERFPRGPVIPGRPAPQTVPEVVSKPQIKVPMPTLPAPAPIPALVPAFLTLAGIATAVGVGRALGRDRGRLRGLSRSTAPAPSPQPGPPIGQPQPLAGPLVGIGNLVQLGVPQLQPSQNLARRLRECRQAAQRCEKKRRKNRKTCWKGYFVESSKSTRFKKWFKVDCRTGRQLPDRLQ